MCKDTSWSRSCDCSSAAFPKLSAAPSGSSRSRTSGVEISMRPSYWARWAPRRARSAAALGVEADGIGARWAELGFPALNLSDPWHGYPLSDWKEENADEAEKVNGHNSRRARNSSNGANPHPTNV